MAPKKKIDIMFWVKIVTLIPTVLISFSFLISLITWIPLEYRDYKDLKKKVDFLEVKIRGASPDDIDAYEAAIREKVEIERIIEDAKKLIPLTQDFFKNDLPEIKKRLKKLEDVE
jgi:hypothetical protein